MKTSHGEPSTKKGTFRGSTWRAASVSAACLPSVLKRGSSCSKVAFVMETLWSVWVRDKETTAVRPKTINNSLTRPDGSSHKLKSHWSFWWAGTTSADDRGGFLPPGPEPQIWLDFCLTCGNRQIIKFLERLSEQTETVGLSGIKQEEANEKTPTGTIQIKPNFSVWMKVLATRQTKEEK